MMHTVLFWFLLAAALAFVVFALAWDRPGWRGRPARRCRRCWYDMGSIGDAPVACPECGAMHRTARSLRRTRRRWGLAFAAVVPLLGAQVASSWPGITARGWIAAIPDPALIVLYRLAPEPPRWTRVDGQSPPPSLRRDWLRALDRELWGRLFGMPQEHVELLLAVEKDPVVDPGYRWCWLLAHSVCARSEWGRADVKRGGVLLETMLHNDVLPAPVLERLARESAESSVEHRARWPRGVPLYVRLHTGTRKFPYDRYSEGSWMVGADTDKVEVIRWTSMTQPTLRYQRDTYGHRPGWMRINYGNQRFPRTDPGVPFGKPRERVRVLVERFDRERGAEGLSGTERPVASWEAEIRLELVDSVDEIMTPVSGAEVDALVRDLSMYRPDPERIARGSPDCIESTGYAGPWGQLENVAIAARVLLERDGEPRAAFSHWFVASDYKGSRWGVPIPAEPGVIDALRLIWQGEPGWRVIIESDPELALRAFGCDRYWSGRVEIDPAVWLGAGSEGVGNGP